VSDFELYVAEQCGLPAKRTEFVLLVCNANK